MVLSTFLFSVDLGASCTIRQEKEIKGLQTENEDDPAGKHIDLVKKKTFSKVEIAIQRWAKTNNKPPEKEIGGQFHSQ